MADETADLKAQAEEVKEKASKATEEVREKTTAAAQKARSKARSATRQATKGARDQAEKVVSKAKTAAKEVSKDIDDDRDPVKGTVSDLGGKVREGAQNARERVQAEAERGFQQGKNRVVTQVSGVAQAFRKTSEQLRAEDQSDLAGYTDRIADGVERVSDYLDDKGLRGAVSDLEGFARQRPAIFVGGALAVGLLAARFLRASGPRR